MKPHHWGDNDKYWGPFTFARQKHNGLGLVLDSGNDEYAGCSVRLYLPWFTLLLALPQWVLQPYRERHWPNWDAATVERLGRDYYDEEFSRELGFHLTDTGANLHLYWGKQTMSWPGSRSKVIFLPWMNWRHVRHSYYRPDHSHFWTEPKRERGKRLDFDSPDYWANAKKRCPSLSFEFYDYDGERITARCVIDEREWRFGTGWFKWLSWFVPHKISRCTDIEFSSETGRRKGSWKGGTVGTAIKMTKGETIESAFRRYCSEHEMTFIGELKNDVHDN